jgi:hypothetical protein
LPSTARIHRWARRRGVRALKAKGVTLKATEQPIDTGTAAGKCFLDLDDQFLETYHLQPSTSANKGRY